MAILGTQLVDNLVAGDHKIVTGVGTIGASETLVRGTVLGKKTLGAVSDAFAGTGDGVLTPDGTTPLLAGAQAGDYRAVCIAVAVDSGTFRVYDPKGNVLGDVAVAATFQNQLKFVIADGATDFVLNDEFTITVAVGSGELTTVDSTALDGSQYLASILAQDATTEAGETVEVVTYESGQFSEGALVFGGTDTVETHREAARDLSIYFTPTIAGANGVS